MKAFNFYPACGLNSYEGYGRAEIGFLKGASELGLDVHYYPSSERPTLQFGNPKWGASPYMEGQRRWLWTMIESTQLSDTWRDNINAYYERVIVPSPDMVGLFQASGVSIPIHYIPLGIDAFPTPYCERQYSKPFTFLTYSYGDIRKGADLTVMAFLSLYMGNPDYKLIIKARDNADIQWLQNIKSEQIEIVGGTITEDALRQLWAKCHAFIFPSRAEGFGLPPRESTLAGLPTVTTQWLGMWDADKWAFPLGVHDMRPCQYMQEVNNKRGALWSEPSFEDVLHWMQWIPDNYAQALVSNKKHRSYLLNHFTCQQSVKSFADLLGEYA